MGFVRVKVAVGNWSVCSPGDGVERDRRWIASPEQLPEGEASSREDDDEHDRRADRHPGSALHAVTLSAGSR